MTRRNFVTLAVAAGVVCCGDTGGRMVGDFGRKVADAGVALADAGEALADDDL